MGGEGEPPATPFTAEQCTWLQKKFGWLPTMSRPPGPAPNHRSSSPLTAPLAQVSRGLPCWLRYVQSYRTCKLTLITSTRTGTYPGPDGRAPSRAAALHTVSWPDLFTFPLPSRIPYPTSNLTGTCLQQIQCASL